MKRVRSKTKFEQRYKRCELPDTLAGRNFPKKDSVIMGNCKIQVTTKAYIDVPITAITRAIALQRRLKCTNEA